ncbi:uncharacterized beta-barrel protein YwiB (DUF1934 family) [Aneurinibacillus soli]|uniref:Putative beta-barrel protein YwiB n=1 Tax=Aneurinibacillus soli TaxID=1500254 RepID=A0A0U5B435_9BACL|nr:DUF1934 domain-containing protein [Aneurinibacillus soli]PYE60089.1 uncharacterized beta-barrel protein YwiB (DUF1934 family) [Aneurinibacillus soli]BAU26422.1 putative beta-barrel protein YwiB [Aneurinibacillus soli]
MGRPPVQQVAITIESRFVLEGGRRDKHEYRYAGELHLMNGTWYIKYVEQDEAGETNATMKVRPDEVVVIRNGLVSMRQSFRPGVPTSGIFESMAGPMQMDTETTDVRVEYDEEGYLCEAVWNYTLFLNEQEVGRYMVTCSLQRKR